MSFHKVHHEQNTDIDNSHLLQMISARRMVSSPGRCPRSRGTCAGRSRGRGEPGWPSARRPTPARGTGARTSPRGRRARWARSRRRRAGAERAGYAPSTALARLFYLFYTFCTFFPERTSLRIFCRMAGSDARRTSIKAASPLVLMSPYVYQLEDLSITPD